MKKVPERVQVQTRVGHVVLLETSEIPEPWPLLTIVSGEVVVRVPQHQPWLELYPRKPVIHSRKMWVLTRGWVTMIRPCVWKQLHRY